MRPTPLALLVLSGVLVFAPAVAAAAQAPAQAPPVILASGEHEIRVAPDQAWATVSLQSRDAKGAEARRLGAAAMTTVMAALKGTGLPADAIQTVGFSLNPEYEYVNGRQRMKGFILSNQVQVRIDDVSKVADVLDAVGGLSLPPSSMLMISGLRFDLKNRAAVERDALRGAVEEAMARARSMAAGAGVTLGRTLRVEEAASEGVPKFPMVTMARQGAMNESIATPIEPSDIEIRAQVVVTVEIR